MRFPSGTLIALRVRRDAVVLEHVLVSIERLAQRLVVSLVRLRHFTHIFGSVTLAELLLEVPERFLSRLSAGTVD